MLKLCALAERLLVSTLVGSWSSPTSHVAHWPSSRGVGPVGHRLRLGTLLKLVAGRGSALVPLLVLLAVLRRARVWWRRIAIASYGPSRACQRRRDGRIRRLLTPAVVLLLLLGSRLGPSSLIILVLLAHVVHQR